MNLYEHLQDAEIIPWHLMSSMDKICLKKGDLSRGFPDFCCGCSPLIMRHTRGCGVASTPEDNPPFAGNGVDTG
jgi:hypothetical protein